MMNTRHVGRMGKKEKQPSVTKPETLSDSDSAPSTTPKSLEVVEWRDANFDFNGDDWDGDYICATVGWTEEEDIWLKISSEITPNGERAVTRVPLVLVTNRTRVSPRTSSSESTLTTFPGHMDLITLTSHKSDGKPDGLSCSCVDGGETHDH